MIKRVCCDKSMLVRMALAVVGSSHKGDGELTCRLDRKSTTKLLAGAANAKIALRKLR